MTVERMVELLEIEKECVLRNASGECNRYCAGCDLLQDDTELHEMYTEVLALLKAQEPIAPIQGSDDQDEDIFCCGSCGAVVGETFLGPPGECEVLDNYCPECGRAVKWDG